MDLVTLVSPELFAYVIMPVLIFFARVCDVSMGTVRIIALSRGQKYIPPILGFFEILIWLLAIGTIMENLTNIFAYMGYAAGFATGNLMGQKIERRISMGMLLVRIITKKSPEELTSSLTSAGYGFTVVDATGTTGKVSVVYTVIRSSSLKTVTKLILKHNPKAFYSVEDIRSVGEGIFPPVKPFLRPEYRKFLSMRKKAK